MDTIDEQLDNAVAKVNDLRGQLAAAQENLETVTAEKATLEAINAELTDNLTAAKDKLATQEVELHEAHAQIERLKADAKSAEQRAAEFYGASAGRSEAVTPKLSLSAPFLKQRGLNFSLTSNHPPTDNYGQYHHRPQRRADFASRPHAVDDGASSAHRIQYELLTGCGRQAGHH